MTAGQWGQITVIAIIMCTIVVLVLVRTLRRNSRKVWVFCPNCKTGFINTFGGKDEKRPAPRKQD